MVLEKNHKLHNLYLNREQLIVRLSQLDKDIAEEKTRIKEIASVELIINDHAIDRFCERIMNIPRSKIKSLFSSDNLYKRYLEGGDGKYRLSQEYPYVIVCIRRSIICTCYNQVDSDERFFVLKSWIERWIDERVDAELGLDINPIKLKTFRKIHYR